MAFGNVKETLTFKAASNLDTEQFKIVELTGNAHEVELAVLHGGIGVIQNHPRSGEAGSVALSGITKVRVGTGGVAVGDFITSAATGWAIVTTTGDAASRRVFGRALTAAATGGIATMLIDRRVVSSGSAL